MGPHRRLYRANGTPLSGLCAGVADYFDVDAIVTRVVAVTGTIVTVGLLGVAYVIMSAAVPKKPDVSGCYDVRPQSAVSDKSGPIRLSPEMFNSERTRSASQSRLVYRSVGHMPPEPPESMKDVREREDGLYDFYLHK